MVKVIAMLKRKPGISLEEFRKHYEEVHAPLALNLVSTIRKYVRNYIKTVAFPQNAGELQIDCITEVWFENMEGFQAMMDLASSDGGQAIREDEEKFLDRANAVYLLVEEVESEIH